jgi:hypothetical protein
MDDSSIDATASLANSLTTLQPLFFRLLLICYAFFAIG